MKSKTGKTILDSSTSVTDTQSDDASKTALATYAENFQRLTRLDTYMVCIGGCGLSGAIFLLVLAAVYLWLYSTVVIVFLVWPFVIVLGFLAGAACGTLVSLVLLPINASLGWPLKPLWFSFVVGGLSGFFPFFLLMLGMSGSGPKDSELIFFAATGPLPHMVLGHLSAYWYTEKTVNDHNGRFGVVKFNASQPGVRSTRFGITHIMTLTIWVALGFSLLSFFTPEFLLLLAKVFFPLQVVSGLVAITLIGLVSYVRRVRKHKGLAA